MPELLLWNRFMSIRKQVDRWNLFGCPLRGAENRVAVLKGSERQIRNGALGSSRFKVLILQVDRSALGLFTCFF